jgi:serine/threonine-protein kinase HipA
MSPSIRFLRIFLHLPRPLMGRRAIGYISQFGDIVRMSFDAEHIEDAQRPTFRYFTVARLKK